MLRRRAGRRGEVNAPAAEAALELRVRGIVQGVGFRPFVYRLARRYGLTGWVLNGASGVRVHAEGDARALDAFARALVAEAPAAARIASVDAEPGAVEGHGGFAIRESDGGEALTVRIAPDLPVCEACLRELFDPHDRRYRYPYITCTDCGPRYSIVTGLPYDRPFTTMAEWPMCAACEREYHDPANRRFHAQPLACRECGPGYVLHFGDGSPFDRLRVTLGAGRDSWGAIEGAAGALRGGAIVAVKGVGGYHLACDARNAAAIEALRARKYRKERPFALMARDLATARTLIELTEDEAATLTSIARPIVVAPARVSLEGIAPENSELGVMLPYAPLHHLLFAAGAPDVLVMTSANRSSEPMAFEDDDALESLAGIADAFLIGERRIARRLDDSVVRASASGTTVLRRARGMAPEAVAFVPSDRPILAVGGDLKNAPALVVDGQVFAGQYVGDLDHLPCRDALERTVGDLCAIYGVRADELLIAHDAHPEYASTAFARALGGQTLAVQHHRAHVASVLAETGDWETEVVGVAFDGTGFGDDGTIWGGEVFTGSVASGFAHAAHLRAVPLPGGDAAARYPVQAAAGFLYELDDLPDLTAPPFAFPPRYRLARETIAKDVRTFRTTSVGRLFDTVAALLGFTREITFEGQAAMWLEHVAAGAVRAPRRRRNNDAYELPLRDGELDHRPLLRAIAGDRSGGGDVGEIAFAFHAALASAIVSAHAALGPGRPLVASGGVFQNRLLVELLAREAGGALRINRLVPPNDGGLALGQAALAAFASAGAAAKK
ncbi:MAG TPA: carbamoyltransferase HypF [Candidatus Elarobacter sp.]|nr:carbamoyltransferase HypF [Candidatus Elarobacter sp.]